MSNTTPMSENEYDRKIEKTIPFYSEFAVQILEMVRAEGYQDASWLDTGCGTGTLVEKAVQSFPTYRFSLCDPSAEMIQKAKEKLTGVSQVCDYQVCGSEELSQACQFDIVTAVQCHHYLQPEEAADHLARYGKNYFPITIEAHQKLMRECGFAEVEIFWLSYMQLGIYGIK